MGYYYYYYQFYRLGTGGFHKKAKPVRCVTQSQREPIRIEQGRTLLNLNQRKKPTPRLVMYLILKSIMYALPGIAP